MGLGLGVAVLFAVYRWRNGAFEWSRFVSTFRHVRGGWLSGAVTAILLAYAGRAVRWSVMLRPLKKNPSVSNILKATLIGFTAIVLFGRVGELVRPYLISVKERVPLSSQMAAWLLERMFDLLMILLIFGIALAQAANTNLKPGPHLRIVLETGGLLTGITGAICLAILAAMRHFTKRIEGRLLASIAFLPKVYQQRIAQALNAFSGGLESTRQNGFAGMLLFWSGVEWTLLVLSFICLFKAFPATARLSAAEAVIFLGFVSLGSIIQIPGIGGGMQVAAILVLTELFGYPLEVAAGIALAVWVVTFVIVVPFGLTLAFQEGLKWGALTHVAEDVSKL
ncbi:MAG TPA: lysylphosphatidylglycerol synthase transmembrane domain-containing protein [Bryobacteraceae bacterium]|nr:lysylphosphatidylglycerol synthase transmembrane domain-containing protein [Bryobacteraceae bacterium]